MKITLGDSNLVQILLNKGADPFHSAEKVCRQPGSNLRPLSSNLTGASLVLAAGHGRRDVIRLLLAKRQKRGDDVISLEDFLADDGPLPGNDDVTMNKKMAGGLSSPSRYFGELSKPRQKILLESMYHAAENGFLDVVMDLRAMGEFLHTDYVFYVFTIYFV